MSFSILILLAILCSTNACLEKCHCLEYLKVIDCTNVGWSSIPDSQTRIENYTSILLRDNNLRRINISALLELLPQLITVDLRANDPDLCDDIQDFYSPKPITIIADCNYTSTTAKITTTLFSTKPPTHHQNHLTYTSSTGRNQTPNTSDHKQIMKMGAYDRAIPYIYSLIATLLFIPASIILLRSINSYHSMWKLNYHHFKYTLETQKVYMKWLLHARRSCKER